MVMLAAGGLLGYLFALGGLSFKNPANAGTAQAAAASGRETISSAAKVFRQGEGAEEVIVFEVLVPGDALLEIDGARRTQSEKSASSRRRRWPPEGTTSTP